MFASGGSLGHFAMKLGYAFMFCGLVAVLAALIIWPFDKAIDWIKRRPVSPSRMNEQWQLAAAHWFWMNNSSHYS
jgi:hypothetical protein